MGRRWEGREMTEALQEEANYSSDSLLALFERAAWRRSHNPIRERRRKRAAKEKVVLLRVPNYFEEAGAIEKVGSLEIDLMNEYFGGVALDEWRLWGPTIKKLQETDKLAFVEFERIAERAT